MRDEVRMYVTVPHDRLDVTLPQPRARPRIFDVELDPQRHNQRDASLQG